MPNITCGRTIVGRIALSPGSAEGSSPSSPSRSAVRSTLHNGRRGDRRLHHPCRHKHNQSSAVIPSSGGQMHRSLTQTGIFERDVNVTGTIDLGFMPLSAGQRVCPGRQVAVRAISTAMAALVHAFDWESLPEDELSADESAGGLNCLNINPLVLQPRLHSHISLYH